MSSSPRHSLAQPVSASPSLTMLTEREGSTLPDKQLSEAIPVLLKQLSDTSDSDQSLDLDYVRNFLASTLGWERKQAIACFTQQLSTQENITTLAHHLQMQREGKFVSFPLMLKDTYAQQVSILVHPRPLRLQDGSKQILATLSLGSSTSGTHQESERQRLNLLAILDRLPEFVALVAPDFTLRYINKPFKNQIGLSVGDSCYNAFTGVSPVNQESPSRPYLAPFDVFETGSPSFSAWKSPRSGRSYRFLSYPFTDTDGSPLILLMGLDITQLKRFQEKLEITERQFHLITQNLSLAIAVIDGQHNITAANRKFRYWFNIKNENYPFNCPVELTHKDANGACQLSATIERTLKDKREHEYELITSLHETDITLRVTVCPLHHSKQYSSVIILLEDITEKKKIAQRTQQMRKLEAMSTLAAGIAHEINQPLSALRLYASGLELMLEQRGEVPADTLQERLEWILRETGTIKDIITHMRALVSHQDKLPLKPSHLHDAIAHSLTMVQGKIDSRDILLETQLDAREPVILAQPVQLEQVIVNIIINAAHALEAVSTNRRIRIVTTETDDTTVTLDIEDNGPGLNGLGDKIFDPFFTTKTSGKSMGLGLSLVHTFVTSWNGTITATSPCTGTGGTKITIMLPLAQE